MNGADTVRVATVESQGGVKLGAVPRPRIEPGSVLVSMRASGICGTDLEKLSGGYTASTILGHEVSGVVVDSKSFEIKEGESVVPHHHVACGECYLCRRGSETMCSKFRDSNFVPGGFADEFLVPKYNVDRGGVHKTRGLSHEEASFAEPLGCCIRGLNKVSPDGTFKTDSALVVGAGPVGLLHMEILRSRYPELMLVAIDVSEFRLDFAERNEAAIVLNGRNSKRGFSQDALKYVEGRGFDLVVVATGNADAFAESIRSVRKSGKVLLFGAAHRGSTYALDIQLSLLNELSLISSYATTEKELAQGLDSLEKHEINVKKFVTSTYSLENVKEAMRAARSEDQIKVLVTS